MPHGPRPGLWSSLSSSKQVSACRLAENVHGVLIMTEAPPGEVQPPDLEHLESAMESQPAVRSMAATLLLVIASFYTLYFARAFFLPVTFGLLLNLLLSPVVRGLKRAKIPEPVGAAIVVLTIVVALATAIVCGAFVTQACTGSE